MIRPRQWLSTCRDQLVNTMDRHLSVCTLCQSPHPGPFLCPDCRRDLPRNDHGCLVCALPLPLQRAGVCGGCLRQPPDFVAARIPWRYGYPADRLLTAFKYSGQRAYGLALADAWVDAFLDDPEPLPDALIPCPIGQQSLRSRHFNQSLVIADHMGRRLGIPVWHRALIRTRDVPRQATLNRQERLQNMQRAFAAPTPLGGHLAIIDDVVTTGATARAMSAVLRAAGADSVRLWGLLRA